MSRACVPHTWIDASAARGGGGASISGASMSRASIWAPVVAENLHPTTATTTSTQTRITIIVTRSHVGVSVRVSREKLELLAGPPGSCQLERARMLDDRLEIRAAALGIADLAGGGDELALGVGDRTASTVVCAGGVEGFGVGEADRGLAFLG